MIRKILKKIIEWIVGHDNLGGLRVFVTQQGGTGTDTKPTTGQILIGQSDGSYEPGSASDIETDPVWESEKSLYAKKDDATQTIIAEQFKSVGDVAITYDGDLVDTITIGSRVVTFTNDGSKYTSWTDTAYTWTPTYTGGKLTALTIT